MLGRVDGNSSYNSMGDNWGSHRFAQVKLEFLNTYIFSPSKADISPKQLDVVTAAIDPSGI